MTPNTRPGWRDVFQLVQDSEARILAAVEKHTTTSATEHQEMQAQIRALQDANLVAASRKQGEARVLGMARSTLALLVSLGAGFVTLWRAVTS